jgi:hydrogenase nickel incorporation protein HypA/HybF
MHELSIAQEILRILEAERQERGFETVHTVRVRAGALSGIDRPALQLAWEAVREGTVAAESEIELQIDQGRLVCLDCGQETSADLLPEKCPKCHSLRLRLEGAMGMTIDSLEVD